MEPVLATAVAAEVGAPAGEFSVGRVITRSLSIWWRNALLFSGVALLINLPVIALGFVGAGTAGGRGPAWPRDRSRPPSPRTGR
jgi:hypothetical protein